MKNMMSIHDRAECATQENDSLRIYAELQADLLRVIDGLARFEQPCLQACVGLEEKLREERFNLVTVGQFKRGKTCLVNALLRDDLLPSSVVPLTSVSTVIRYGEVLEIAVDFLDGSSQPIAREELEAYVTETLNPRNAKAVKEVRIAFPAPLLQNGVELVDTPGVGSVHGHNTATAYAILPRCDAALFLLSADQPPGEAELAFLRDVRQYAHRIFFLFNKIDYLAENELAEAMAFTRKVLEEAMGMSVRLFPVSAKLALRGRSWVAASLLEQSRLPAFVSALEAFLIHEKGKILLLSAAGSVSRLLAQARLELGLERQSLSAPLAEIDAGLASFRRRRQALVGEKRRLRLYFKTEVDRLLDTLLEQDLRDCRTRISGRLRQEFEDFVRECPGLALGELDDALASFIQERVGDAYGVWRAEEESRLVAEFATACRVFAGRAAGLVDELQEFAARLFHLPRPEVAAGTVWLPDSTFTFRFEDEPAGLELLEERAVRDWPGLIGNRFPKLKAAVMGWANRRIIARRREDLAEAIERQSGRLRHDFMERLEHGRDSFATATLQGLDAAAEGIEHALEQGRAGRACNAADTEARRAFLESRLQAFDAIGRQIGNIREQALALESGEAGIYSWSITN